MRTLPSALSNLSLTTALPKQAEIFVDHIKLYTAILIFDKAVLTLEAPS